MHKRFAGGVAVVGLSLALGACTGSVGPKRVEGIEQAQASETAGCDFLGDVTGVSGWYGVFASEGLASAKVAAQQEARELGADTVVFEKPALERGSTSITAQAYRCGAPV
jgi:hypothetical protein